MLAGGDDEDDDGRGGRLPPPDATTYRLVMRAWANSSHPERGRRAARWLRRQWAEHERGAARRGGTAAAAAPPSVRPTVDSYNTVISAWADLGEPDKAEAALAELLRRSDGRRSGSFGGSGSGIGTGDDGGGARGKDDYDDADDDALAPNSESFALVIRGWLKAAEQRGDGDALASAARWVAAVRELEREGRERRGRRAVASQVDMYGGILSAARRCAPGHPDALALALDAFDELRRSHHQVEGAHYSRLLEVGLLSLSRPEDDRARSEFVSRLFADCCEAGHLTKPFVQALANGPVYRDGWTAEESARAVSDLVAPGRRGPPPWPLPASWTRNVRQIGLLPEPRDAVRTRFDVSRRGSDPARSSYS
jgi:pentatricopeptide repeat protein